MSHLIVPGLAFAIASSPATFKLTRKVAGPWVSSFEGVATPAGLFLHTLFFLFILYLVGRFMPRMSGYGIDEILKKRQDDIKEKHDLTKQMQQWSKESKNAIKKNDEDLKRSQDMKTMFQDILKKH